MSIKASFSAQNGMGNGKKPVTEILFGRCPDFVEKGHLWMSQTHFGGFIAAPVPVRKPLTVL